MLPPPSDSGAVLVTGASSGIGEQLAREFARRGYRLVLVARRAELLQTLADSIGPAAHVLSADLSHAEERAALPGRVAGLRLYVEVLVNNAGLSTLGPIAKSDTEAELRLIEVDVSAVADLCSRFVPDMVQRGRGAVLNVASVAAYAPLPGQAAYGAAKAFVLSYTRALAAELRGRGVTATAVCPGPVKTGFAEAAGSSDAEFESAVPGFMWVDAKTVATTAIDGLDAGKTVVVPGLANRIGAAVSHLTPRRLLLPFMAARHPALKD